MEAKKKIVQGDRKRQKTKTEKDKGIIKTKPIIPKTGFMN